MNGSRRDHTRGVVEFRKPLWSSFFSVIIAGGFAAFAFSSDKDLLGLVIIGLPALYSLIDSLWALRNPYLSIAPWKIVYHPIWWRSAVELSPTAIAGWRVDGKKVVFEQKTGKPVTVKLDALSKKDRARAVSVLRERGYGELES